MGDPDVAAVAREQHPDARRGGAARSDRADLPLAEARNAGADAAIAAGAEALVFLDVDCIPEPTHGGSGMPRCWLGGRAGAGPVVACGEVRYLPPVDHPAEYRPRTGGPRRSRIRPGPRRRRARSCARRDVRLFWSLSFAITARDWQALGGFDEDYVGYGAEDTDFGQRLAAAHGDLLWVGGAAAYHQHHPTEVPPRPAPARRSCATPTCSTTGGDGSRWRAGSPSSRRGAWPSWTRPQVGGGSQPEDAGSDPGPLFSMRHHGYPPVGHAVRLQQRGTGGVFPGFRAAHVPRPVASSFTCPTRPQWGGDGQIATFGQVRAGQPPCTGGRKTRPSSTR